MKDYTTTEETRNDTCPQITEEVSSLSVPTSSDPPEFKNHGSIGIAETGRTHASASKRSRACGAIKKSGRHERNKEKPARERGNASVQLEDGSSFSSPFGLGTLICNSHKTNQRIEHVFVNLKDKEDLVRDFLKMKSKVEGNIFSIKNKETGEIINLPNGSRWNSNSRYFSKLRARLFKEIEGLRHARLLTLSFDPVLVESHIPHWWPWNVQEFLIVFGNLYISRFLKRFQTYWKRQGRKWHYIACVMEIQPGTGNVHYHLVFRGSWIGDAKTLLSFWEGSNQPAGLEISKRKNAKGAIRYIAKYVTKLESFTGESKWKELNIFMWYFRVRIYNIRHHKRDKTNVAAFEGSQSESKKKFEYVRLPSPSKVHERMEKMSKGTWTVEDERTFQEGPPSIEGVKMTGNLKIDLKKITELPVLYPDQIKGPV